LSVKVNKSLDDGLVLYVPMNEGSGSTVYDRSKNGNNGAITGASWVVDEEKCLSFDGVNDRVVIPYDASTSPVDDSFSWCFWVKNAFGDNTYPFSTMGINGYYIRVTDKGTLVFVQYNGVVTRTINGVTSVPLGEWAHCVVVRDVDTGLCRMYVNGVKIHEESLGVYTLDRVTNVSVQNVLFYAWYGKGLLRDLRMYRKALTDDEVSALYRLGENKSLSDGLVLDMPLNEGSGSTVYDKSKYSNNGAISGATWTEDAEMGECLSFDGIGHVNVGKNTSLFTGQQGSVSFWTKFTTAYRNMFFGWDASLGPIEFSSGSTNILNLYVSDGLIRIGNSSGIVITSFENIWVFIVGTWDADGNIKVYINGNYSDSGTYTGTISTVPDGDLLIGYRDVNWSLKGLINDVRLYNRALSDSEINQLYRLTKKGVE